MIKKPSLAAYSLLLMQFVLLCLGAGFIYLVSGKSRFAWSFVGGGLINVLPNGYFAYKLFQYRGVKNARKIVNNFYFGEVMKMVITAILFVVVFKSFKVAPLALFGGFIVAQLLFWAAPLFFKPSK